MHVYLCGCKSHIKCTLECGLFYTHFENFNLIGFSDSDWAGDIDDKEKAHMIFMLCDRCSFHLEFKEATYRYSIHL